MPRWLKRTLTALLIFGVALSAGYTLSARLGPELLRRELEVQLAKRLRGEVSIGQAALLLRGGLRLEGTDLSAYPQPEAGPALTAASASARIDLMSLALGQLRLDQLRLEGLVFRIEHRADGSWSPYPIAAIANRPQASEYLEQQLVLLRAFEAATRWLLEKPELARQLELIDSQVIFLDSLAQVPQEVDAPGPYELRLDSIQGRLRHHWISEEADLELRATLAGAAGAQGTLEVEGHHRGEGQLRLAVAATAVALEALSPFASAIDERARLAGQLFGVIAFQTETAEHGRLEIDWVTHLLDSVIPLPGTLLPAVSTRGTLDALIEIHPGRLRLSSAEVGGSEVQLALSGAAERPLRESAGMRLTGRLQGVGMTEAHRFIGALPEEDRDTLRRLLERVQAGHINQLGATGSARISEWRKLFAGQLENLPPGFVLDADLAQMTLETSESDRLEDVAARVQWSADRFEVRDASGNWNETPLPELGVVVEGATNLFLGAPGSTELRAEARPLPGLATLFEILLSAENASDGSATGASGDGWGSFPTLRLDFARLDHPVLRWPIDDAQVVLEPSADGAQLNLLAHWAGAPVRAEAVWAHSPESRVDVHIAVDTPGIAPATIAPEGAHSVLPGAGGESRTGDVTPSSPAAPSEEPWAFGQFEIGSALEGRFAFEAIGGGFRIVGSSLDLTDVRVSLPESGHVDAFIGADLGGENVAGVELRFEMSDAPVPILARAAGIPEQIATGRVAGSGFVTGHLRSGAPLISGLRGAIEFEARRGELQMKVPLVVAVAQATEGFNPLAERGSVKYETASARLELADSRISTERFAMEGPMRVLASGEIDLRDQSTGRIDAVVGVFLFRQADAVLGEIPLLGALLSDKGLLGAYFHVLGPLAEPDVKALPVSSIAEAVPDVIKAPLRMLGFVLRGARPRSKQERQALPQPNRLIEPAAPAPVDAPAAEAPAEPRPSS